MDNQFKAHIDSIPKISAIHESGHATVKCCLNLKSEVVAPELRFDKIIMRTIEEVSAGPLIIKGKRYFGTGITFMNNFDSAYPLPSDVSPGFEFSAERRRNLGKMDIVVALAGPMAEARYRGCSFAELLIDGEAGAGDWQAALKIADCIGYRNEAAGQLCSEAAGLHRMYHP